MSHDTAKSDFTISPLLMLTTIQELNYVFMHKTLYTELCFLSIYEIY